MATLEDFKNDFALFVEGGLLAIKQGDEDSARKLFNAAKVLEPDNAMSDIGIGIIALHKMDLSNAQSIFEKIMAKGTSWRAQAFLSLCCILMAMQGKTSTDAGIALLRRSTTLAEEVIERSDEPTTIELARSVLNMQQELLAKAK